jgi:sigma-E factor negative regulatory protein RseB
MRYVALLAILALPQGAWSGQDAKAWLDKMTRAMHSLNYEGTFIFMHGDRVDTMQILHERGEKGVRERLTSLSGEAREVVLNQGVLTCVWSHKDAVTVQRMPARNVFPSTIPTDTAALDEYYRFEFSGRDRIAGMTCRTIAIEPVDKLRYGHRLCIAHNSGVLLRSVLLSAAGVPIEEVMFTSVRLRENIPDERFAPTTIEEDHVWHGTGKMYQSIETRPDPGWRIERMPPGFEITGNIRRIMVASPQPVQHMILTDGLASVSVFIAKPQNRESLFKGAMRSGALNAFARSLDDFQITVVGEVPADTVKMIGKSIVYQPNPG